MNEDGCTCQECGKKYHTDLLIPDKLWNLIRPMGKQKGAGLLCGSCIMLNLEELADETCKHFTLKAEII